MTVHHAHATGTPVEQRDACGALRVAIPAAEEGPAKMAPQVLTSTIEGEATCDYGQFASLLLLSVARLCRAGAPNELFGEWRVSMDAIARLWATCLEVISQRSDAELATLRLDHTATSSHGQRGEFILALRALRGFATPLQLAAFDISDADFERIDAGSGHASCPFNLRSPTHKAVPLAPAEDPHWLRAPDPTGCCAHLLPCIRLFGIHGYPRPAKVGYSCAVTSTQDPPGYTAARDTCTPQTPRGGPLMCSHGHPRPSGVSGCP